MVDMVARIQKWGNSQGVRIPRGMLNEALIAVGDEVEIGVEDGEIIIRPTRIVRGRHNLGELLSRIPKNHLTGEEDWGAPRGKETW